MTARGDSGAAVADAVSELCVDVPDFPRPGIVFKDLSPFFANGEALRTVTDVVTSHYGLSPVSRPRFDVVAGVEARGFLLAGALAYATRAGVVPLRKAGKLPRVTLSAAYELEYGTATLEVHEDAFVAGQRVLVVDDVLATGGTAQAAVSLIEQAGGNVVGVLVVLELEALHGRERLAGRDVHALLRV